MYRVANGPRAEAPHRGERPRSASGPATNGAAGPGALGYTTVTVSDEGERDRLEEETRLIQAACREYGLGLGKLVRDVESHSADELGRPGLSYVLERLAAKEYRCLVVTRLERLTRSPAKLAALVRMLDEHDARLIVIDIGLDTATADGRVAAKALVTVGELDAEQAAARPRRRSSGRPSVADRPALERRIIEMRARGMTLQAIADTLNAEGVPTVRGGAEWRPSSVQAAAGYRRPNRGRRSE
jgi:DNA invertase Pin-like site-specific DNA recombinase